MANQRPRLSFWQIWNMSFGFLGIQFGFALQGAFMSPIFKNLGATDGQIPLYWIAAPLTGLIVQPIVGYLSDRTWSPRLGRRRPFFLIGAVLSSIALIFLPHSPVLWIAVGGLWILDASINISMEPFRALVADKLPDSQRTFGFVVQTLIIGIGTWVASQLPWFVKNVMKAGEAQVVTGVPDNIKVSFLIGGLIFLGAVLYTIFTTKEYPPEDMQAFEAEKEKSKGLIAGFKEIAENIGGMPRILKKIGLVQFFSWFAFFTMWNYATIALQEHSYNAPTPNVEMYDLSDDKSALAYSIAKEKADDAANVIGGRMGVYGLSSMVFALLLTFISARLRVNRRNVHLASLVAGGLGFVLMYAIKDPWIHSWGFALIGISWGSILSMPYAMLSSSIDENKMGMFMGIFNMFITIPQIVAGVINFALFSVIYEGNLIRALLVAGASLIIAGLLNLLITEASAVRDADNPALQ